MKKLLILLLLVCSLSYGQEVRTTIFAYTEAADKNTHTKEFDYGFNVAVGIDYQMSLFYLKGRLYWFPQLNSLPYFDFQGIAGFNYHLWNESTRIYSGIKAGLTARDYSGWYPLIGIEVGGEWYFDDKWAIGIEGSLENRTDDKAWNPKAESRIVNNAGIKLSYIIF